MKKIFIAAALVTVFSTACMAAPKSHESRPSKELVSCQQQVDVLSQYVIELRADRDSAQIKIAQDSARNMRPAKKRK